MNEEWRTLARFPDYAVSNLGRVRRLVADSRNHRPRVLAPWINNKGYEIIGLCGSHHLVSRLVCEAFHGPAPSLRHDAAHGDGVPRHNTADNLRWATRAENMADCVTHGTQSRGKTHGRTTKPERTPRGERHGHSKLNEDQILRIRAEPKLIGSGRRLAAEYGVSPATICIIRSGKTWRHL